MKWSGKNVLDIGCGTGEIISGIKNLGATSVTGIDYANNAIEIANSKFSDKDIHFFNQSLEEVTLKSIGSKKEGFDVVISLGTIEHMDNPGLALKKMLKLLKDEGQLVITCPYFINVRGIVWMSLALLLDVPMSLTDKHFISPFNIEEWLLGTGFSISTVKYFDYEKANGDIMIDDMKKRLTNAMNDSGLSSDKVPDMIRWLSNVVEKEKDAINTMNGASSLYVIKKEESSSKVIA